MKTNMIGLITNFMSLKTKLHAYITITDI